MTILSRLPLPVGIQERMVQEVRLELTKRITSAGLQPVCFAACIFRAYGALGGNCTHCSRVFNPQLYWWATKSVGTQGGSRTLRKPFLRRLRMPVPSLGLIFGTQGEIRTLTLARLERAVYTSSTTWAYGAAGWTWTTNPLLKRQVLYVGATTAWWRCRRVARRVHQSTLIGCLRC